MLDSTVRFYTAQRHTTRLTECITPILEASRKPQWASLVSSLPPYPDQIRDAYAANIHRAMAG